MLNRVMSHHGRGGRPCLLCDVVPLQSSVMVHILGNHREELFLEPKLDGNKLLDQLEDLHLDFLSKLKKLYV